MDDKLSNTFQIVNEKIPATVRSYMAKQESCLLILPMQAFLFSYKKCLKTHHDSPNPIQIYLGGKDLFNEVTSLLLLIQFFTDKFQQTYLEIYMWSYLNVSQCIIQNNNPSAAKKYCNHIINFICIEKVQ